jgi:hypothetical protein
VGPFDVTLKQVGRISGRQLERNGRLRFYALPKSRHQ